MVEGRWNHNIHHHRVVLDAITPEFSTALDVGCGDGLLAADLANLLASVTAIDLDPGCAQRTAARLEGTGHEVITGDVLTHDFTGRRFDLVASVATLHHMDLREGLHRLAELVRPGGVLVVVGLARSRGVTDLGHDLAGAMATRWYKRRRPYWEHGAPICWPPPATYAQVRHTAHELLPGVRYQRHVLWRYSLVWANPTTPP